ncbi:hypothetical protein WR25_04790 [Diploscapter pachys]|uniref:Glucosylceramidase n=1 Tax=Diploscapter pachys TaxID=2018661 RepID=A0A2A2LH15_9BILA|nr:hypothetical protein WR25_04790 [Diploscapter pachys]
MMGFGGAFTDAAGINLASLPPDMADTIIRQYFSKDGLGYTIGRVPVASCDFSARKYSYDDTDQDFALNNFNLTNEDFQYKIPYIQKAISYSNNTLKLFGSPWAPPGWMKTNGDMKGGGQIKGDINGTYYQTWAQYFIRFFEEYHKNGIDFWGITIQNEPTTGQFDWWMWQTCLFTPEMQRDFIKNLFGPVTMASPYAKNVKLMILDDNRGNIQEWSDKILSDPDAAKYVSGIAVHWYQNQGIGPQPLTDTHNKWPDYWILATEACNGWDQGQHTVILGDWGRGAAYAYDIITDIQNWVTGWTDWNLSLNLQGGPNWVMNFVDAPLIVNASANEFYKQPMWHVMGHFSKFVPVDSYRIDANWDDGSNNTIAVGFLNPDGTRTAVILNQVEIFQLHKISISQNVPTTIAINEATNKNNYYTFTMEANSIATLIFR